MELLNSTSTSPINVVNNQLAHNIGSPLLDNSSVMEPNNLSQSAARELTSTTTVTGEAGNVTSVFTEHNLELKLPILSSSSSESESEETINPLVNTSAVVEGERAASPPPNCAICLGRCKNKCFTDSCMHQFCFKCLCEWSKVKPECPLCKQTFKSIIHNVKSIHQFEEYHVQPPTVQIAHPPFEMDFQEMRIFGVVHPGNNRNHVWNEATHRPFFYGDFSASSPYSTASTGGSISTASGSSSIRSMTTANGSGLRNQYVYRGELLDLYRQEYPGAIANSGTLSQLWRRYVYDRKLYAMPVADITGRFRESSARFYRDNPAQIHRLLPWINRDIVCLLRQTQHDVTTVLESINSALTLMNIVSPAFRRRLQPYLGTKTAHFIHELNNFARSPYDIIGYDRAVRYSPQTNNEEIVIEFTSSDESTDNEQIDVAGDGGNNNTSSTSRSRTTNASSINAINLTIHNRLTSASGNTGGNRGGGIGINSSGLSDIHDDISLVIDLMGESDNNETTSTAQATTNSSNYQSGQNAGMSEGDMIISGTQPTMSDNIELTSGSSDECEFVLERKPPHLRTPEMVSLDSASDSDVVFVDESKPLNKTSFSSSEGELNEGPRDHKHQSRQHNKIAALVEAKKRNKSANLVKSEQQGCNTDAYDLGASTSAASRLSLQKRIDKSNRSDGGPSSKKIRREKYSLRNSKTKSRAECQAPKRRGKCLDSESSHSSTSSTTTTSSSSFATTSANSSSSSSDEDYVAGVSQRKTVANSRGKMKKGKVCNSRRSGNQKHDKKKRNKKYCSSDDDDDDEDENGHMGKNFALVMAVNERRKRQNQKNCTDSKTDEVESDEENSWRLNAINEPLRQQQQQQAKCRKRNERKMQRKTSVHQQQPIGKRSNFKRQKNENQQHKEQETQNLTNFNSEATTSDESDNINLIQLKTKLTAQNCHKELRIEPTNSNQSTEITINYNNEGISNNSDINDINTTVTPSSTSINTNTATTISETTTECTPIPIAAATINKPELLFKHLPPNQIQNVATATTANPTTNNFVVSMTIQNESSHFSDDSNDNIQINVGHHHHLNKIKKNNCESINNYQNDHQQQLLLSSLNNYNNNNNQINNAHSNDENTNYDNTNAATDDNLCNYDETVNNVHTIMNLNETNVFGDGTSISTTTTDTILNEAAEQISSAAVNFYNPQQTFNTADFADENSTNSSSSDSSISSSTTSQSSSSNSSSSNTSGYINYYH